jgi:hypothetical protein
VLIVCVATAGEPPPEMSLREIGSSFKQSNCDGFGSTLGVAYRNVLKAEYFRGDNFGYHRSDTVLIVAGESVAATVMAV